MTGAVAAAPVLSVIVPAWECADQLQRCLAGLEASDLSRADWECIVVDDGSRDRTPDIAEAHADRVLRVAGGPRGPGHARNRGAELARGDVLVFVDADVVVARDTLRRFVELFAADSSLTAAFGAYDAHPADPGLVSQYRNLLHRWVHLQHAGEVDTFWAGCGAVRREAFLAVGGFDAARYPRPQVEDIELGYRLRDHGARILLVPAIEATHLKRWTLRRMLRTDLLDRAAPWMRLLLARRAALAHGTLNLAPTEKLLTVTAAITMASVPAALVTGDVRWHLVWGAGLLVLLGGSARFLAWLSAQRGPWFALRCVPLRVLFYACSALGAAWAVLTPNRQAASGASRDTGTSSSSAK